MKLLALCPKPDDATAWYRVVSPIRTLARQVPSLRISISQAVALPEWQLSLWDVALFQRPVTNEAITSIERCKLLGVRTWVDYDDDYTGVPTDNSLFHVFGAPHIRQNVEAACRAADFVTVTTEALQAKHAAWSDRVVIVPNALDDGLGEPDVAPSLPVRTVLWRGGDSHREDLAHFHEGIVAAAWQFEASWKFLGMTPYKLLRHLPEHTAETVPFVDMWAYLARLRSIRPSIVIVPLKRTPFNLCKSQIAMIEALWAGAVPLVPKWPTWLQPDGKPIPGVEYYEDPLDFSKRLTRLGRAPLEVLTERAALGLAWVRKNLSVSRANKIRAMALQMTMDGKGRTVELPTHAQSGLTLVSS